MKYNVLLVGAGQLGSRYLQGMVSGESQLSITVVDPSSSALETAKSRWIEAGGDHCHHQIRWATDIPTELEKIDLTLVVTSAKGRAELVKQIASQMAVRYWVLEKVLAQSIEELEVIFRATGQSHGSWVNTPRRMMRWHTELKEIFAGNGPLSVTYSAGLWGLACNSIHYIDLVAWWSGESLVSVDASGLANQWIESKRAGYFEITGELVAQFSDGTVLRLASNEGAVVQPLRVELNDSSVWEMDEPAGLATGPEGQRIKGQIEFQSQLSGRLVDDILLRGQCGLPSLEESSAMHAIFLDAMLTHWNHSQNRNDEFIPIT